MRAGRLARGRRLGPAPVSAPCRVGCSEWPTAPATPARPMSSSTTRTRRTHLSRRSPGCGPFARARGGALWCVFGCGGNRDAAKRPRMGAIAARSRRPRRRDQRQPARRSARKRSSPRSSPASTSRRRRGVRTRRRPGARRSRRAVRRRARGRRRPGRGQGPRGRPGDRRREGAVLGRGARRRRAPAAARTALTQPPAGAAPMMTLGDAARLLPGARSSATDDADRSRPQRHPDAARLATSSSPCAASASTALEFLGRGQVRRRRRSPGGAGHRRRRPRRTPRSPMRGSRSGALVPPGARRFAALPLVAVGGSNGKTTTTQMVASILRAWRRRPARVRHRGQLQQRHRLAADAAAPARRLHRAGGGRARHEPRRRDRPAGADRRADDRARQQRAARAPGVHGQRRGGRARERRARSPRSAPTASPVFPADDAHAPTVARAAPARAATITFALGTAPADVAGAAPSGTATTGSSTLQTPAGAATLRAAPGRHAQRRATRSPRPRGGAGRRRAARRDRARPGGVRAGDAAARSAKRSRAPAASVDADRRQLQRQPRFGARRRSTCSPRCRRRAGCVLGDMGEVGDAGPGVPSPRSAPMRASAASSRCWAAGADEPSTRRRSAARAHFADVDGAARRARRRRRAARVGAGQGLALHAAWSASSPRSRRAAETRMRAGDRSEAHAA